MAHFYAAIMDRYTGNISNRTGRKETGMEGHIRGWSVGARVKISNVDGQDVVKVFATKGSNGGGSNEKLIAEYVGDEKVSS